MSVNQELSEQDITQRTSLIVYLRNASNDQFKLRRYGDVVYFSKKLHYLVMYVNASEAEETAVRLRALSFVKGVDLSAADELKLDNEDTEKQLTEMAKEAEAKLAAANNGKRSEDWIK